jgi:hypothetical protein
MSKGPGHVERTIIELLAVNKTMTAPILAAFVYQDEAQLKAGGAPVTASQLASVRRALAKLQKQGQVIKLGHMIRHERCSYASPATARAIIHKGIRAFGSGFLEDRPDLARFYAEPVTD